MSLNFNFFFLVLEFVLGFGLIIGWLVVFWDFFGKEGERFIFIWVVF